MNRNEEIIKAIESSDLLTGGALTPEQQDQFVRLVRQFAVLLAKTRIERMNRPKATIDKLNIGEPITRSHDENTLAPETGKPLFTTLELSTKKLLSHWSITTEALQGSIERERLENTIMTTMIQRASHDFELLAIQGNTTAYAAVDTPQGYLLRRLDGWDYQTESAHIVDAEATYIRKAVFSSMLRAMPETYIADPDLFWIMPSILVVDWMDTLADRQTGVGDRALQGQGLAPFGIPILTGPKRPGVPLIPTRKDLTVMEATSAEVIGTRQDPFKIETGVNDAFQMDVDNAGAQTLTIPAGIYRAHEIAALINAHHSSWAGVASDDGQGRLILKSPTVGATSEIDIQAVANDAYDTLGLSVGVTTGSNAGVAGVVPEGTFMWLANPRNFIWGIYTGPAGGKGAEGTRIYSEFKPEYDRINVYVYTQVDAQIENLDAIVKCINLRKRVGV